MKFAVLPGSLRRDSFNKKLARQICLILEKMNYQASYLDLASFEIPLYNGDLEKEKGVPPAVLSLNAEIQTSDALIIATPEYNGSIPGVLKNTIDWLSRTNPCALIGKPILMTGASPGALGAVRSLWHSRVPLEAIGGYVYPEMFGLPKAHEAFDPEGRLKDAASVARIEKLLGQFSQVALRLHS